MDVATVLLVEVYRELGLTFGEIMQELNSRLTGETDATSPASTPPPTEEMNNASLAMLQSQLTGSTYRGVR